MVGLRASNKNRKNRENDNDGKVFLPPRSIKLRILAAASAFSSSFFLMISWASLNVYVCLCARVCVRARAHTHALSLHTSYMYLLY